MMTIESVSQMWSGDAGGLQSPDGQTFSASFGAAYQVVHSVTESVPSILTATDGTTTIPQLGDVYPGTTGVYCTNVGPVQSVGPIMSIVPVQYEGEISSNDPSSSPLNKDPEILYQSRTSTEEIDSDIFGQPLTNSIGEPVTGIKDDIWDYALSVKRNFLAVSTYALRLYARSYSSDVFWDGWPAGTASLQSFTAKPIFTVGSIVSHFEVSAVILFREPYNTIPAHAWWKRYRNEGLNQRFGTRITFSGGGGQGATAYAITDAGAITAIAVTNRGNGYMTPPTVNIASDTSGTGATATATISDGRVTGVTVTAGGSNYRSKVQRAPDGNKADTTTPVLLKADGTIERNAENAIWIERPTKRALPYGVLGLV